MLQARHWCVWIEGHTGFHAQIPNALEGAVQVGASFYVHCQDMRAQICKGLEVPIGIDNHQMHIQGLGRVAVDGLDDWHAKTDVWHKHPIHHIKMKPVRIGGIHHCDIPLKVREIRCKHRRSNHSVHGAKLNFSCDIRGMGRPKIVGLTGGLGSGKSVVRSMFLALGIPAWDADQAGHAVYRAHPELRRACAARWGDIVLQPNGDVNRKQIAQIVFSSPAELEWLNQQVHPLVQKDFEEWLEGVSSSVAYVIRESAILFESQSELGCDAVICVSANEAVRIDRAMKRDGTVEADVRARMSRQWTDAQRESRSDFVIRNDESVTLGELSSKVDFVHRALLEFLN